MIEIIEFESRHLTDLTLQEAQSTIQPLTYDPKYGDFLVQAGPHFSAMLDGIVIGCAGVWMIEPHRGMAWALIADGIGKNLYHMHKAVRNFLIDCDVPRLETPVDYDFVEGHRWARMLGFKPEGVMRSYYANGADAIMYSRVS